jgi:hypothetical protein
MPILCLSMALQPFVGSWPLFQFPNPIHTRRHSLDGGSARHKALYLYTERQKRRINAHRHPCLEWDSNPLLQCSSGGRLFMPYTARPLWSAFYVMYHYNIFCFWGNRWSSIWNSCQERPYLTDMNNTDLRWKYARGQSGRYPDYALTLCTPCKEHINPRTLRATTLCGDTSRDCFVIKLTPDTGTRCERCNYSGALDRMDVIKQTKTYCIFMRMLPKKSRIRWLSILIKWTIMEHHFQRSHSNYNTFLHTVHETYQQWIALQCSTFILKMLYSESVFLTGFDVHLLQTETIFLQLFRLIYHVLNSCGRNKGHEFVTELNTHLLLTKRDVIILLALFKPI